MEIDKLEKLEITLNNIKRDINWLLTHLEKYKIRLEKQRELHKEWREKHREHLKEYHKKWREIHPEYKEKVREKARRKK